MRLLRQKDVALDNHVNEVAQTVVLFFEFSHDAVHFSTVDRLKVSPGGIGQHLLGQA